LTNVVSPKQWGAKVDYDAWTDPIDPKDKIIVHYGGGANSHAYEGREGEEKILQAWERYHLSKGWRGLAYGWAIGCSGTLYRIRGWNRYGAHRGDLEPDQIPENREAIPVVFLLGGSQEPTPAAYLAFEGLRRTLETVEKRGLPLYGHQEIAELGVGGTATACPGKPLMKYVRAHRTSIKEEADVDYRKVKNVPDKAWAKEIVDRAIESKRLVVGDAHPDDWNEPVTTGRLLTILDRDDQAIPIHGEVLESPGLADEILGLVAEAIDEALRRRRGEDV